MNYVLSSTFDLNLHGMLNLAAGAVNLTLGIVVLINNPRSNVQTAFFRFTVASSIWVICYGFMSLTSNSQSGHAWLAAAFIGVAFIPTTLLHFSETLSASITPSALRQKITWIGYGISVLFMTWMAEMASIICSIASTSWGRFNQFRDSVEALIFFYSLMAFFVVYTSLAYINFFKNWRQAPSPSHRSQFLIILVGFSIGYFGMFDFAVARGVHAYPFGYLTLTVLVVAIAYAIARHQLWDINLALKRFSLFLIVYVFLLAFTLPAILYVARAVFNDSSRAFLGTFIFFNIAFGTILSMGPLLYAWLVRRSFWLKTHATSGITHELRSPIGTIQSAAEILEAQLKDADVVIPGRDKLGTYIEIIRKNSERLQRFVDDLLVLAKLQDETPLLDLKQEDMRAIVAEVIDHYRPAASLKGLDLRLMADEVDLGGYFDRAKLKQVLSNLLSNAVRYSQAGFISVVLGRRNGTILCSVEDSGQGIRQEDLHRIFDRFYQGTKSQGSGLGLTIAKAWVEAHKGRIWADSPGPGRGTTVTFTLPVG